MESQHDHLQYIQNAVIPPPQISSDDQNIKYTRIVIDSKDRDTTLFPEPNSYEIRFDDDIDDVMTAELLAVDVPLSSYLVNKYFKEFSLVINDVLHTVILDEGNFTETGLATMMATKLNDISMGNFQVEYNEQKDNFIFNAKIPFQISFVPQQNGLHSLLGFRKAAYIAAATGTAPWTYVVASEYRKNFKYNNYIIMTIDQFDVNKSNSNTLHKTFAVVMDNFWNTNVSNNPRMIKTFSPPIARLARIKITFADRFGNLYDFQNIDHRIELLFTSFKQKRKYQNIFLNR